MVDREAKRTEGKGIGYDRWASMQLPKRKDVVAEIQSLISEKNECCNDYREKSDRLHELMTMQRNYQIEMQPQRPKHGRKHEAGAVKSKMPPETAAFADGHSG